MDEKAWRQPEDYISHDRVCACPYGFKSKNETLYKYIACVEYYMWSIIIQVMQSRWGNEMKISI